jgi:Ciliary BBSome complex subunit 1
MAKSAPTLLSVWDDPLASMTGPSQGVVLADTAGDGDARLVVSCGDKRMRVVRGSALERQRDVALPGVASATTAYYADDRVPRLPVLVAAVGSTLFAYRCVRAAGGRAGRRGARRGGKGGRRPLRAETCGRCTSSRCRRAR